MSQGALTKVVEALRLSVFQRDEHGRLRRVGRAPEWLSALWPEATVARGLLRPGVSPFLDNFLVDAAACWEAGGTSRAGSGMWEEQDARGGVMHLQATAFTAGGRATLLIEELGTAYEERKLVVQKAHEAALACEKLQRAEQALAKKNRLLAEARGQLERRVRQRTAELSEANTALKGEIAARRLFAERLQGMRELEKAILTAQSPQAIAEVALRRIGSLLPCEHASVVELDAASERATILASVWRGQIRSAAGWQLSSEQLATARVLESGNLHRVRRTRNLFGMPTGGRAARKVWPLIVDVPLMADHTLIGVLNLATDSPAAFTPDHEEIALEIAGRLAVAIRQARLFGQISAGREQLRALSLRLVEVQEAERRFIAHELHDQIGQALTGLKLTLELPGRETATGADPAMSEAVGIVDELMQRVRQLSLDLRPQLLDDLGLLAALNWLFKKHLKQTGLRMRFEHTPLRKRLPAQLETAVFRIVQEALTNVARHAGVKDVMVRLWLRAGTVGVQIEDKGAGFDVEQALAARASSGLPGMRERAVLLGGEFTLDSAPGAGTRLTVQIPLDTLGQGSTAASKKAT